ncbi:DUF2147 domain-containing protein [Seohaeicola zhoushanensis]
MCRDTDVSAPQPGARRCGACRGSDSAGRLARGVWLTQPDRKGGYAHIRAHACGPALCGTVEKAFDRTGAEIWTPNVGKRVFWDMWEDEQGHYRGRAWVPMLKREYPGSIRLLGDRLQVHGCSGPICMSQTWTR